MLAALEIAADFARADASGRCVGRKFGCWEIIATAYCNLLQTTENVMDLILANNFIDNRISVRILW
jgi:hypothetical protein